MKKRVFLMLLGAFLLSGCEVLQSFNPFYSGVKIPDAPEVKATREVKIAWTKNIGESGKAILRPAVLNDKIFAASFLGKIKAFQNNALLWEKKLDSLISAGVGLDPELLFIGGEKGEVWALLAENGETLWKTQLSSEVVQTPVSTPAGVLVKTADERLFLLNRQNGKTLWFYQHTLQTLQVRDASLPIFAGGFIFAGFSGGKLLALSPENGAPIWQGQVAIPKGATELDRLTQVATPLSLGESLCAAAYQGQVACFNMMQGGQLLWSKKIGSANALGADGATLYVSDDWGIVHALNRQTGASLWKNEKLKMRNPSALTEGGGVLGVADLEGILYFLNPQNGEFLAKLKTDGSPIVAPLLYENGQFVAQTAKGNLFVVEIL